MLGRAVTAPGMLLAQSTGSAKTDHLGWQLMYQSWVAKTAQVRSCSLLLFELFASTRSTCRGEWRCEQVWWGIREWKGEGNGHAQSKVMWFEQLLRDQAHPCSSL